ncbi:MAG: PrgI family protein [Planctomycetaceae bacterium]|nr:PrgI family protein [Planctomycetaceae bacterium]
MSQSPQKNGLSVKQWGILLLAFLMGVGAVFVLDKVAPVQNSTNQAVQVATENR